MTGKTILITGANRGIGRGLFNHYAAEPNNTVIAAVRNPEACRQELEAQQPRGEGTKLVVVQLDQASKASAVEAVRHLRETVGIERIDVVIANAGVGLAARLEDASLDDIQTIVQVNGVGPLLLYQATLPLLRAAAAAGGSGRDAPKFALISSGGGSIAEAAPSDKIPLGVYGASKALANYFTVRMGAENDWLVTLCICPGYVFTDMSKAAEEFDLPWVGKTIEASAVNTSHIIDNATKEEHSGKFFNETIDKFNQW